MTHWAWRSLRDISLAGEWKLRSCLDLLLALLIVLLLADAQVVMNLPGRGVGVIKDITFQPPGCKLRPSAFSPETTFYMIDCPQDVSSVSLDLSSPDHLEAQDGSALVLPVVVQPATGEAKLIQVLACAGDNIGSALTSDAAMSSGSCTKYMFDVKRKGSSEATLSQLVVVPTNGRGDVKLSPAFSPVVHQYTLRIPYGGGAELTAEAGKGGFVSFESLAAADRHLLSKNISASSRFASGSIGEGVQTMAIYVASSDGQGQARYGIDIKQLPNDDATLEDIRFNDGKLHPKLQSGRHEYRLEVEPGTKAVAISATASDHYGAMVNVNGVTGRGYSSSLIKLEEQAPFYIAHIHVLAADQTTAEDYAVSILSQGWESLAMLSSLKVDGCQNGLRPEFRSYLHNYRCILGRTSWNITATPIALYKPDSSDRKDWGSSKVFANTEPWTNGAPLTQSLDDSGFARLQFDVQSADGDRRAIYTISAEGYPYEDRIKPVWLVKKPHRVPTTTQTTTSSTTPTTSSTSSSTVGPMLYSSTSTTTATSTSTTRARVKIHFNFTLPNFTWPKLPKLPKLPHWHLPHICRPHLPRLPRTPRMSYYFPNPSFALRMSVLVSSGLTLVACKDLTICTAFLKRLQLVALTAEIVTPGTLYSSLAMDFGAFNLWIAFPSLLRVSSGEDVPDDSFFDEDLERRGVTLPSMSIARSRGRRLVYEFRRRRRNRRRRTRRRRSRRRRTRRRTATSLDAAQDDVCASQAASEDTVLWPGDDFSERVDTYGKNISRFWTDVEDAWEASWQTSIDARIGHLALACVYWPSAVVLLIMGWRRVAWEERLTEEALPAFLGWKILRFRFLPFALILLDAALIGFTDSVAMLFFQPREAGGLRRLTPERVEDEPVPLQFEGFCQTFAACVPSANISIILLLLYPVCFGFFGVCQLCLLRRRGRLRWSPFLKLYTDARSLAITLCSPNFSVAEDPKGVSLPQRFLRSAMFRWARGTTEVRNAVPVRDIEGEPLHFSSDAATPDGVLFGESDRRHALSRSGEAEFDMKSPGEMEVLVKRHNVWRNRQERIGMLLWVERWSAALEALRFQILEAGKKGVITDVLGTRILDVNGEPLTDLYQYCIYQFHWRPWINHWSTKDTGTVTRGLASLGWRENMQPREEKNNILAPWVPPAIEILSVERAKIDSWLEKYLLHAEIVERTRDELRLLKWRRDTKDLDEDQAAFLRELAIAVLLETELRVPQDFKTPAERESREDLLATKVLERRRQGIPLPWQPEAEKLQLGEANVTINSGLVNSYDIFENPAWIAYDQDIARFGIKRFHIRSAGQAAPVTAGDGEDENRKRPASNLARTRTTMVSCMLPLRRLKLFAGWLSLQELFCFAVPHEALRLPTYEHWVPLFPSCGRPGSAPGLFVMDAVERVLTIGSVIAIRAALTFFDGFDSQTIASTLLMLWQGLALTIRVFSSRGEQHWLPFVGFVISLLIWLRFQSPSWCNQFFDDLCVSVVAGNSFVFCWRTVRHVINPGPWGASGLLIWGARSVPTELDVSEIEAATPPPKPPFGIFEVVDSLLGERPIPFMICVPALGMNLRADACCEPFTCTDERRMAGCRKRFAFYEAPLWQPHIALTMGEKPNSALNRLMAFDRFVELRDSMPICMSRAQFAGSEELRELVCTIHVINHAGCYWSSLQHDSVLSLFMPQGLDDLKPVTGRQSTSVAPGTTLNVRGNFAIDTWRDRARLTPESPALIQVWRREIMDWLSAELAAAGSIPVTTTRSRTPTLKGTKIIDVESNSGFQVGDLVLIGKERKTVVNIEPFKVDLAVYSDYPAGTEIGKLSQVEHNAQDVMLHGGRKGRGAVKAASDEVVVPGIFSDEGLGAERYIDSRCCREGRVLHYVIFSKDLKVGLNWRPDPLSAIPAGLSLGSQRWRPCMLQLGTRSVIFSLRLQDADGAPLPRWRGAVVRKQDDLVEYDVPFFYLDRIEVVTNKIILYGRDLASAGSAVGGSTPAEPVQMPASFSASGGISSSGGEEFAIYEDVQYPISFIVGFDQARIWDAVVQQYQMTSRDEQIRNYIGSVLDHPHLPGIHVRHGPEGEQLWDDGKRYVGAWAKHVYDGHGVLMDSHSNVIYRGQWQHGMKHGEGTWLYRQGNILRTYSGQWVQDEFRGSGEIRVIEDSLEELRSTQPAAVVRYTGKFDASEGQFARGPDLMHLDPQEASHSVLIETCFPTIAEETPLRNSFGGEKAKPKLVQLPGFLPRDFSMEFYGLDGNDLRHCGPDDRCEIIYADGTRYVGPCLIGAIPDGHPGTLWEANGSMYEGRFVEGVRSSSGRISLPNGIVYEGQFSPTDGSRDGEGNVSVPADLAGWGSGEVPFRYFKGHFEGGLREGEGEMALSDYSSYVGAFQFNLRAGSGTLEEQNGSVYTGPWVEDEPGTGEGEITYSTGHSFVGGVSSAMRHGAGKLYSNDQLIYEGQWRSDEMDGDGTLHMEDGIYTGRLKQGKREGMGKFTYFSPPGVPSEEHRFYEGEWARDKQHGLGTYMDEYGYLNERASFVEGQFVSPRRPPPKTFRERFSNSNPKNFKPVATSPSPQSTWPKGRDICKSRGKLSENEPLLEPFDRGSGEAHARLRPVHLGPEGLPGVRWA